MKSFVFRSDKPFNPAKLEDFLGAIVQVYGPKMLRYKGVLHMKGSDRKVIFQGVHQLMGSDLGPKWAPGEKKSSKMVFIGIDLPRDDPRAGPGAVPGLNAMQTAHATSTWLQSAALERGAAPHSRLAMSGYKPSLRGGLDVSKTPAKKQHREGAPRPRPPRRDKARQAARRHGSRPSRKPRRQDLPAKAPPSRADQAGGQAGRQGAAKAAAKPAAEAPAPSRASKTKPSRRPSRRQEPAAKARQAPRRQRARHRRSRAPVAAASADRRPRARTPFRPRRTGREHRRKSIVAPVASPAAAADRPVRRPLRAAAAADPTDEQAGEPIRPRRRTRPIRSSPTPGRPRPAAT